MSKRRKKKVEEETLTITEQYAIMNAADNLLEAQELARINADTDLMLAISDRWLNLSKFLAFEEELAKGRSIGFVESGYENGV